MDGRLARQDRKAGGHLGRERGQSWAPLHAQVPDLYCLKPRGGRQRGIGPGSELAILKGTRVTCADWRSSSPGLLWPSAGALGEGSGVPSAGESPSCDRNGDPWRRLQADLGPRQGPSWGRSGPSPASCKPEAAEGAGGTGRLSYHSRPVPRAVGFR